MYLECRFPTNNAKDVSNVGNEDDEQIDGEEQTHSDGDVTEPAEGLLWEQELEKCTSNLRGTQHEGYADTNGISDQLKAKTG